MELDSDLKPFIQGHAMTRRIGLVLGVVMGVITVGAVLMPADPHEPASVKIFLGLLFGIPAGLGFFRAFRPSFGLQILQTRTPAVVWVYLHRTLNQAGHHRASAVMLGLETGRLVMLQIPLGPEAEAAALLAVTRRFPQATQGYDPALAASFKANPKSLQPVAQAR